MAKPPPKLPPALRRGTPADPGRPSPRKPKHTMFGSLRPQDLRALGVGLELSLVIGGFAYGGHWLDQQWGTDPWLLLIGLFLGIFGGSWHTIKTVNGGKTPDIGLKPKPKAKPNPGDAEKNNPQK